MAMIDHTAVGTLPLLPVKDEWARRAWARRTGRAGGWLAGLGQDTGSGEVSWEGSGLPGGTDVSWQESIPVIDSSGNATGVNWNSLLSKWTDITGKILTTQYGQPAPGTVITTANGQYIRQATGVPVPVTSTNVGVSASGISNISTGTGIVLAAVVGVVLLGMIMKR